MRMRKSVENDNSQGFTSSETLTVIIFNRFLRLSRKEIPSSG